jgi:hypothetical protein
MVRVDDIVSDMQQAKNLHILVLDACRDNPLAEDLKRSIGQTRAMSMQRGLAKSTRRNSNPPARAAEVDEINEGNSAVCDERYHRCSAEREAHADKRSAQGPNPNVMQATTPKLDRSRANTWVVATPRACRSGSFCSPGEFQLGRRPFQPCLARQQSFQQDLFHLFDEIVDRQLDLHARASIPSF